MRKYRDENFEFVARDLSFDDRVRDRRAADKPGVLIETVSEGGWAALAHIAEGDLLLSVDGKPVKDVAALETIMKDVAERKPARVVMHIQRGIRPLFVELEPTWGALVVKEE
jgi:S1-C subfamily serine protease